MTKIVLHILLSLSRELPQNIIGGIIYLLYKNNKQTIQHHHIFIYSPHFAVSLGRFIFWNKDNKAHEFGHAIQSLFFGPLYLILIGIPSIIRKVYSTYYLWRYKHPRSRYFEGYPENRADQLGEKRTNKTEK